MYKEIDGIIPPNDKDPLWRYTNFEKFVNLLDTRTLFYTRADKFEDPYEGFIPQRIMNAYREHLYGLTDKTVVEKMMQENEIYRKYVMCNCWHQNLVESMAMWEKYHMRNSGVAIKTTLEKMKNSLLGELPVCIGKVEYIYNDTDDDQYMQNFKQSKIKLVKKLAYFPYFRKRKEYEHEQEVRLIVDIVPLEVGLSDICDTGMPYYIDIDSLIEEVIISPYAEDWITETVRSVVQKYGFNFEVKRSTLLDVPTLDETIIDGGL